MKLNKPKLFLLIWIFHLFIYYMIFAFSNRIVSNDYEELYTVLLGLIGWFEQIPMFFIVPIVLMFILIKTKLKNSWFIAYVSSILFSPDSTNLFYSA